MTLANDAIANWGAVALLTSRPGSSVVITAPGLDYRLQRCASVICHGDWTPSEGRTFTGADQLQALSHAVEAFGAARCAAAADNDS